MLKLKKKSAVPYRKKYFTLLVTFSKIDKTLPYVYFLYIIIKQPNMAEEEVHPIELDDGNAAPIAENVAAAQEDEGNPPDGPSPEDVYNRLVIFERNIQRAWEEFTNLMLSETGSINERISALEDDVRDLERTERRKVDFAVGQSVVLLDERKIGTVTNVTKVFVDVELDGAQNRKKTVRKKKTLLARFAALSKICPQNEV